MAELNWIDKNERPPTAEDASPDGLVYIVWDDGLVAITHLELLKTNRRFTHWLPFREMPVPKRWRVPTIHDLAKAGKPIPCRVRDETQNWFAARLAAIDVSEEPLRPFMESTGHWYKYCEICDA